MLDRRIRVHVLIFRSYWYFALAIQTLSFEVRPNLQMTGRVRLQAALGLALISFDFDVDCSVRCICSVACLHAGASRCIFCPCAQTSIRTRNDVR
jgi:hypothetical protein